MKKGTHFHVVEYTPTMLDVFTSSNPDVRPPVNYAGATYDHPAIAELKITRNNINTNPEAVIRMRNFRDVVDGNGDPVFLEDGITQKAEYGPIVRSYNIDLYTWVAQQPNALEVLTALNTLITAVVAYDEAEKAASLASSSSSGG